MNAFGIYRQEVSPKAQAVPLGVEGRASSNTIRFWTGEFYVKLTTPPGGGRMPELEALGAAIAKGLGAPGAMPAEVGWFPTAGQLPDSVKFIPADALGQAAFTNAFEAKYENAGEPATALVVPFEQREGRGRRPRPLRVVPREGARQGESGVTPGDGGFSAHRLVPGIHPGGQGRAEAGDSRWARPRNASAAICLGHRQAARRRHAGQPRKEGSR